MDAIVDDVSAAHEDDWIEGVGEITRRTQTLIFVRAQLQVGDRAVLSAQGVWKFVRHGHAPTEPK